MQIEVIGPKKVIWSWIRGKIIYGLKHLAFDLNILLKN